MSYRRANGMRAVLCMVALFVMPTRANAVVLDLELTQDEPTKGRAVLSGNIDAAFRFFGEEPGPAPRLGFGRIGQFWSVNATITKFGNPSTFNLRVGGQHLKRPPGAEHDGEANQGLVLGDLLQVNLKGGDFGAIGPQDAAAQLIHPGSKDHFDILSSHVDDLNGEARGFLTPNNQISVRIDFEHSKQPIPEPSSLILFGAGLLGLAGRPRRGRRRCG